VAPRHTSVRVRVRVRACVQRFLPIIVYRFARHFDYAAALRYATMMLRHATSLMPSPADLLAHFTGADAMPLITLMPFMPCRRLRLLRLMLFRLIDDATPRHASAPRCRAPERVDAVSARGKAKRASARARSAIYECAHARAEFAAFAIFARLFRCC